jgi:hypothetical protein
LLNSLRGITAEDATAAANAVRKGILEGEAGFAKVPGKGAEETAQAMTKEGAVPPLKIRAIPETEAPPPVSIAARAGPEAAAAAEAAGPFVGKMYRLLDATLSTYRGRIVPAVAEKRAVGAAEIAAAREGATATNIHERLAQAFGGLKGKAERGFAFGEKFTTGEVDEALAKAFTSPRLPQYGGANLAKALEEMILQRQVPTNLAALKTIGRVWPELQPLIRGMQTEHLDLFRELIDAANLPRAVAASMDMSAPMRQGAVFIARKQWWQAWDDMVKAELALGPDYANAHFEKMAMDADWNLIVDRGGLRIADPGTGIAQELGVEAPRQEMFSAIGRGGTHVSEWTAKLPGIAQSQWGYTTFGNDLRWNMTKQKIMEWRGNGTKFTMNDVKALATWNNIGSGWGLLPKFLDKNISELGTVLFAPRFWASRLETYPMGLYYFIRNPVLRRQIAYDLVSFTASNLALLAILKYGAGVDVELDSLSTDFARARFGNTRVDFWAGMQPNIRAIAQMISGHGKSTETGEFYPVDRWMEMIRVLQGHLSPLAGTISDVKMGRTYTGDEVVPTSPGFLKQLAARFVPFWINDLADAIKTGGPAMAFAGPLSFFGTSVLSYQTPFGKLEQERNIVTQQRTAAGLIKDNNGNVLPKMDIKKLRETIGTKAANAAVADDPDVMAAEQAVEDRRAWYGNTNKSLKSALAPYTTEQLGADAAIPDWNVQAWKDDRTTRSNEKAGKIAGFYFANPEQRDRMEKERDKLGDPYTIPAKWTPDDIVARYLAIFTDHTNMETGTIDDRTALSNDLDRFQSLLTPEQSGALNANLGINSTPREKVYLERARYIRDAGWWDRIDLLFGTASYGTPYQGQTFQQFHDYLGGMLRKADIQPSESEINAKIRLVLPRGGDFLRWIGQGSGSKTDPMRKADPQLDADLLANAYASCLMTDKAVAIYKGMTGLTANKCERAE